MPKPAPPVRSAAGAQPLFQALPCAIALAWCLTAPPACADPGDDAPVLAPVRVKGKAAGPDLDDDSRKALRAIPGNVAVISAQRYREGAVMGLRDALSRTAGVYVQNPSGQESAKVSMRGSGISASSGLRGIRLLRDGLPLGRSDDLGDTIYADPFGAERIEVYRGANSLEYGAATLGGAINLVSPTGHSHPGAEWRMEGGSHGYLKGQLRAGQEFSDDLDAFASISSFHSDGFRQNSEQSVSRFYGNIGYKFSPRSQGRLHITSEHYRVRMPGALTLEQMQDDPSAANEGALQAGTRIRTTPRWHAAYRHDWQIGAADQLSLGVFHTGTKFDSPGADIRARYDATDYGAALRHEVNREPGGHRNRFVWGANYSRGSSDNQAYWPDYRP
ncbi:MAG: TonB-dependent receptor plug domain-containing protein, partial [Pollutimonas bauzanensis]